MSDKFDNTFKVTQPEPKQSKFSKSVLKPEIPGKITETLGTGENAKNSLIYLTIKWAFISGCILTTLIVVNYWCFRQNEKVPDITGDISKMWQIIIPVITLSLGYAFGKSQR